jgi:hypothetical protein
MNEHLKELEKELKALNQKVVDAEYDLFQKLITAIFTDLPQVKSIGFKGWVPGFNDGDACMFSATYDYPTINGYDHDYGEWDESVPEELQTEENEKEYKALSGKVAEYLNLLPESFYEGHFGSNFRVTISPEKTVVEEYDCGY